MNQLEDKTVITFCEQYFVTSRIIINIFNNYFNKIKIQLWLES